MIRYHGRFYCDIITSNFYEQRKLTGLELISIDEIKKAAKMLHKMGAKNVLMKGRHDGDQKEVTDLLLTEGGEFLTFTKPHFITDRVNGTGDTLSAVIAAELAKGTPLIESVKIAKDFTYEALSHPIAVRSKCRPIDHWAGQENTQP